MPDIFTAVGEALFVDLIDTDADWHMASGTGTTAPDKADTALETEAATRTQFSRTQSAADTISGVGIIAYTGTLAITECGQLDAAAAGILITRHTFSAINVVNGDSIQFTITIQLA